MDVQADLNLCWVHMPEGMFFDIMTIRVLKSEHPFDYLVVSIKTAGCAANRIAPNQMTNSVASDLGLHCLHRPTCPNT